VERVAAEESVLITARIIQESDFVSSGDRNLLLPMQELTMEQLHMKLYIAKTDTNIRKENTQRVAYECHVKV
jgi:hypothetical protein